MDFNTSLAPMISSQGRRDAQESRQQILRQHDDVWSFRSSNSGSPHSLKRTVGVLLNSMMRNPMPRAIEIPVTDVAARARGQPPRPQTRVELSCSNQLK